MAAIDIYPQINTINAVTKGLNTVLTLASTVNYVENQYITIQCPSVHGMPEIDGKVVKIIGVNSGASQITVELNSNDFTNFIGGALTQTALTIPAGEINTLDASYRNNLSRAGYTVV